MSIDPLKIDSAALQQSSQSQPVSSGLPRDPSQEGAAPAEGAPAEGAPADQVLLSGSFGKSYHDLQLKNDRHNEIAGAIARTDRAGELLGQKIDALKAPLETIVKNYPPFAPEDKERMKLLMSYSSIRKEIDNLILPPPPEVLQARKAQVLPPPLPPTANDSQIADHVAKLDAAAASLTGMRRDLAAQTDAFLAGGTFPEPISAPKGAQNALFASSDSESAALHISAEVGRQFATSVSQGVASTGHSQFLKRLS